MHLHQADEPLNQNTTAYKHAFSGTVTGLWNRLRVGGNNLHSRLIRLIDVSVIDPTSREGGTSEAILQVTMWEPEIREIFFSMRRNILYTARHGKIWLCSITFHIFHSFMHNAYFSIWIKITLWKSKWLNVAFLKDFVSSPDCVICLFFLSQTFGDFKISQSHDLAYLRTSECVCEYVFDHLCHNYMLC